MVTPISLGNVQPPEWPWSLNRTHPMFRSLQVGLTGHWVMWEGGGPPRDISGFGAHTVFPGGTADPVWSVAASGRGMTFDGSNDNLDATLLSHWSTDLTRGTMAFLFQMTSTASGALMGTLNTTTSEAFIRFVLNSNPTTAVNETGKIQFFLRSNSNNSFSGGLNFDSGFTDGALHSLIVTWDKSIPTMTIYLDGISQAITLSLTSNGTSWVAWDNAVMLGARNGATPTEFFNGTILDARFYNRILSQAEGQLLAAYPYGDVTPWWSVSAMGSKAAVLAAIRRQIIMFG